MKHKRIALSIAMSFPGIFSDEDWRAACYREFSGVNQDALRKAYSRAKFDLISEGKVAQLGDGNYSVSDKVELVRPVARSVDIDLSSVYMKFNQTVDRAKHDMERGAFLEAGRALVILGRAIRDHGIKAGHYDT